jgi:hypothetical protein
MIIPKNKYRCAGCQKITHIKNMYMISWYISKETDGSTDMAFCTKCANQQRPKETGRSLSKRLDPALAVPKSYVARW